MRSGPFLLLYAPILFCLFYSRIQAASQSQKGQYFPYFGEFFPNLRILFGFIPKFKRHRLYPPKGDRITESGFIFIKQVQHHLIDTFYIFVQKQQVFPSFMKFLTI